MSNAKNSRASFLAGAGAVMPLYTPKQIVTSDVARVTKITFAKARRRVSAATKAAVATQHDSIAAD